jgi:CRP/FNR family transcriptional regulator, cyclic AMP receptor protein
VDYNRLKALPLFEGVGDEDLQNIAPFVSEVSVSEDKHLVDEGDYSYQLMAIEEGEADVVRGGDHLATLGPGDFFGEMGLRDHVRRSATVAATSPLTAVVMTESAFHQMARRLPKVEEKIRAAVEERTKALAG